MADRYIEILREWNFWNQRIDVGILRKFYLKKILRWIDLPEIIALYGVRRGGKSTILLQLIRWLHQKRKIPYENFLYINFEDPRLGENLTGKDLFNILNEYKRAYPTKARIYLFLDEIQRVKGWERFVLSLYEQKQNIKIFVTGSSSSLLDAEFSTLLSGRTLLIQVMPLTFAEFLEFKNKSSCSRYKKLQLFDEYLTYGGFPRVVLEKNKVNKKDLLISYYNTILERDIIAKNQVRKKSELKTLARYVMSNIGSIISTYSLEKILNLSNVHISKYLHMLSDSFLIFENKYFSYSVKKQIYNPSKIYSVDTGLSNIAGFNFSKNKGKLIENVVNGFLNTRNDQVFYWKNSTEIDFVVFANKKVSELINVTLTVDEPTVLEREITSLKIGQNELKVRRAKLLSLYNQSRQKNSYIVDLFKYLGV